MSNVLEEVIGHHRANKISELNEHLNFLHDRNINNYSYSIENINKEILIKHEFDRNLVTNVLNDGFDYQIISHKEWRFFYSVLKGKYRYNIYNRHEVDTIDDFLWSLGISLPIFLLVTYFLTKKLSQSINRPLAKINNTAAAIKKGSLNKRIPEDKSDKSVYLTIRNLNSCFDELESSYKKINQFGVDIAHELKNPLATAITRIQVALGTPRTNEYYVHALEQSLNNLKSIQNITDSLLLLHQNDPLIRHSFEPVLLAELIQQCVAELKSKLIAKKLKTSISLTDLELKGNFDLIKLLVNNLLLNAIKYSKPLGTIEIKNTTDTVTINNNTGPVIPYELLPKIFDPFIKQDEARSSEGHGLGLSIAKWICKTHGFSIRIESDFELGTTVTIQIKDC